METKWTPGPWFMNVNGRDRPEVVDAHGDRIVEVYAINDRQDASNARLIAAAPDMAEALRNVSANLADHQGCAMPIGLTQALMREVDAALAKIEGR